MARALEKVAVLSHAQRDCSMEPVHVAIIWFLEQPTVTVTDVKSESIADWQ